MSQNKKRRRKKEREFLHKQLKVLAESSQSSGCIHDYVGLAKLSKQMAKIYITLNR